MRRKKISTFIVCLLLLLVLFAPNSALIIIPMDFTTLNKQDGSIKEKEMKMPEYRNTRSPPGWSIEMRLTHSSGDSITPDMAVWDNNVHVVWHDNRNGDYDIYYKRSIDNGSSWSADIKLGSSGSSLWNYEWPKIAIFENNIHMIWKGPGGAHYINSTDNGNNWSEITVFNGWLGHPDVAIWENYVYIVVCNKETNDILFKRSSDNGNSWTDWILVKDLGGAARTSMETDGNIIHVTYYFGSGSGQWLRCIESHDQGDTWINDRLIKHADSGSTGEYLHYHWATSMQGFNLHIVYIIQYVNIGVYSTWYGKVSDNAEAPSVDVDKDHIVWGEKDENNNRQLYSNKFGQVTNYPSDSYSLRTRSSNNIVHVVWADNRDGDTELYYCQRGMFADLTLSNSDIQFTPPNPVVNGTIIFINSTVFSYGKSASNIEVKFYNGDPDIDDDLIPDPTADEIGNDTININKDTSTLASIQWLPPSIGEYNIYVWPNPNNDIQEYNYTNNLANKTLEIIPGIFSLGLAKGWNLISIPLKLSKNDLSSVLESIEGQYDSIQWYNSTDTNDHWKHYHDSKPLYLNDLWNIDQNKGIWLHITEPGGTILTIIENNISTPQNITLYTGWNLVGYPSSTNHNRTEGLNNLTFGSEVDSIWTYDSTTQTWKEMGETDFFESCRGYFIHSKTDCIWEVPL
ncbi:MAG: hypothetical protein JSV09_09950 [Thermoplasmata archaeon]|nr:MAG: hypothetical protein JSV09_09950 [Thermoplasmata archaeon]